MRTVDYVILYVHDLDRAVSFYRDLLRLEHRFTRDGYAEFATGHTRFGLLERGRLPEIIGRQARRTGDPGGEVLFLVRDVDAEATRLRRAGVTILGGPEDRPWGHRTLHVADAEGHIVELAQEIPRRG